MAPRTVLYLTPSVRMLGARQSLLQLAGGLDRARYAPHVVVPERGGLTEALDGAEIPWTALRLRPWRKGRSWPFIPATLWRLGGLAREVGAALLHANEPYPVPYAVRARSAGVPVVGHVRLEIDATFARKYALGRAEAVVAVSEAVAAPLRTLRSGIAPERLHVVYNGLDLDEFRAAAEASPRDDKEWADLNDLLNEGGIHKESMAPVVVGQFGLLSPRKRHADVLAALDRLAGQRDPARPPLLYLVLGDRGPRAEQDAFEHPREAARRLGLLAESPAELPSLLAGRRVAALFLPFRDDVAPWYRLADAILLPSDQEGFGRVLVEAAALGLPSLGSRVGGIEEVVVDGETGLLFDVGAVDQIAAALDRLARDAALRPRLGAAARERAAARFGLATHTAAVQALYDRLLGLGS